MAGRGENRLAHNESTDEDEGSSSEDDDSKHAEEDQGDGSDGGDGDGGGDDGLTPEQRADRDEVARVVNAVRAERNRMLADVDFTAQHMLRIGVDAVALLEFCRLLVTNGITSRQIRELTVTVRLLERLVPYCHPVITLVLRRIQYRIPTRGFTSAARQADLDAEDESDAAAMTFLCGIVPVGSIRLRPSEITERDFDLLMGRVRGLVYEGAAPPMAPHLVQRLITFSLSLIDVPLSIIGGLPPLSVNHSQCIRAAARMWTMSIKTPEDAWLALAALRECATCSRGMADSCVKALAFVVVGNQVFGTLRLANGVYANMQVIREYRDFLRAVRDLANRVQTHPSRRSYPFRDGEGQYRSSVFCVGDCENSAFDAWDGQCRADASREHYRPAVRLLMEHYLLHVDHQIHCAAWAKSATVHIRDIARLNNQAPCCLHYAIGGTPNDDLVRAIMLELIHAENEQDERYREQLEQDDDVILVRQPKPVAEVLKNMNIFYGSPAPVQRPRVFDGDFGALGRQMAILINDALKSGRRWHTENNAMTPLTCAWYMGYADGVAFLEAFITELRKIGGDAALTLVFNDYAVAELRVAFDHGHEHAAKRSATPERWRSSDQRQYSVVQDILNRPIKWTSSNRDASGASSAASSAAESAAAPMRSAAGSTLMLQMQQQPQQQQPQQQQPQQELQSVINGFSRLRVGGRMNVRGSGEIGDVESSAARRQRTSSAAQGQSASSAAQGQSASSAAQDQPVPSLTAMFGSMADEGRESADDEADQEEDDEGN